MDYTPCSVYSRETHLRIAVAPSEMKYFDSRSERFRKRTSSVAFRQLIVEELCARRVFAGLIQSNDGVWTQTPLNEVPSQVVPQTMISRFELFRMDANQLAQNVDEAPLEFQSIQSNEVITVPTPSGGFERFTVYASPIMEPALAAKFPEINTYAGQGIDNPAATIRFDITPLGFHAQVLSPNGAYYVDPYANASDGLYVSYDKQSNPNPHQFEEFELDGTIERGAGAGASGGAGAPVTGSIASRSGTELRTYRTAVAATGEYTTFHGGTVAAGQAAIVVAMNRVTGIYRTELSISFVLVGNNDQLVYTNGATDPYSNNNGFAMLSENQVNVDAVIGSGNYDIGHVFSTGGGGVAALASVGINSIKAQGVTGLPTPIDDAFYVDYVAHEMGHQFGGNHTFNGVDGACGARNGSTAYEPGSGTTIQAYAGICGTDDLQPHSDPYFHSISFDEIIRHVDTTIPQIGTRTQTGNSVPTVNAGADYVIPARTPFVLTATGSDANVGDAITFGWEERDLGPAQSVTTADNGQGPLFRFWPPTEDPSRTFPRLSDLLNNSTVIGERLPTTSRTMNFRAVVRDNRFSGGGVNTDDMRVQVVDTGVPFAVTSPNTSVSWQGNSTQTISWNVAGTTGGGINTTSVDISLSVDGGLTYPYVIASGTPNDGTEDIRIPNVPGANARIKVQGSGNIFFDISDTNFTITPSPSFIDIDMGVDKNYIENAIPEYVGPSATVTLFNVASIDGATLTVGLQNQQPGDRLRLIPGGALPSTVLLNGNQVLFNSVVVGSVSISNNTIVFTANSAATSQSIEGILRRIAFDSTSDDPTNILRTVNVYFDAGSNGVSNRETVNIAVQPVNDAPSTTDVFWGTIAEDSISATGRVISTILESTFSDPDSNARFSGLAIVANPTSQQIGTWEYSTSTAAPFLWSPIGTATLDQALILAPSSRLRFIPSANYFGDDAKLQIRVFDETYAGAFSSGVNPIFVDLTATAPTGFSSVSNRALSISVSPVNDPPIPLVGSLALSVDQDQVLQYVLPPALFMDVDDLNLVYTVQTESGQFLPSWIRFNPTTLELVAAPKNENVGTHVLRIVARDASNATTAIPLTLTVVNVNDPPSSLELDFNSITENDTNVRIGSFMSVDIDAGDQQIYTVDDPRFFVLGNLLYLSPGVKFDYEQIKSVTFSATVTDTGTPPLSLTVPIQVQIINVNEFTPEMSITHFGILESIGSDSTVGFVQATDGDADSVLTYQLLNASSEFSLDSVTGEIRTKTGVSFDRESKSDYSLLVKATDEGGRSVIATVVVDILDVNEFTPSFEQLQFWVPESILSGSVFAMVSARDGDLGQTITYHVEQSDLPSFELNPDTGEFSLVAGGGFNYEVKNHYTATVRATDSGVPAKSAVATLTFTIVDTNDAPTLLTLAPASAVAEIAGSTIGTLSILDEDVGQRYQFVSQDDRFEVIGETFKLKDGFALRNSDPATVSVFVNAIELGGDGQLGRSYPFRISFDRIENSKPWQNIANPFDLDRSGSVDPLDVLALVNGINRGIQLTIPRPVSDLSLEDYDVDGDGALTPLDVLVLVNFLNANGPNGEGEGEPSFLASSELAPSSADQFWSEVYFDLEEAIRPIRKRS